VLITGGTGTLGGLVAGHLADTGRARCLVLASRSGPGAAGAAALAAGLAGRGAGVQIIACDAADRGALAGVLERAGAARPLTGVVHTAGVLDDATIGSLTPDRVDAVLAPKADAAWHLHELTAEADLDHFVLFSSAAATFGAAGQGNYAAANAFLDGLAAARQAAGLPGQSLAWGLWADPTGLTSHLSHADRARMGRGGVSALTAAQGLALLDAAVALDDALLVPARLDIAGIRASASRGEQVPALWRSLVPRSGPATGPATASPDQAASLRLQLAGLTAPEQDALMLDLVRAHAAAVLGHAAAEAIEADRAFTELGFDSLTAVELRNRLHAATGLQLPATLVFDYPAPDVLARHLHEQLGRPDSPASPRDGGEDQLRQALAAIPLSRIRQAGLLEPLLQLAALHDTATPDEPASTAPGIDALDADSLVSLALDTESSDY
jgi:acyl carrier protein